MVCDAADGIIEASGGDDGVPVTERLPLSLAEDDGTGSQACAGFGLAGSNGGALRLFLGTDETGGECITSFQLELGSRNLHQTPSSSTSFIFLHLFKNVPSIRFRRSMMLASSFALVGFAA